MQIRFSMLLPVAALVAVVAAVPGPAEARDQCNGGSVSCCNKTYNETEMKSISGGLLGLVLGDLGGLLAIGCTPITVLGLGSNSCTQQRVCCSGNTFGGLINFGCTPINIEL